MTPTKGVPNSRGRPVNGTEAAGAGQKARFPWGFVVLMLALTALFAGLGVWQLERLAWKKALVAEATQRTHLAPVRLPPTPEWAGIDPQSLNFRPVTITGTYMPDKTVLVFTSLSETRGKFSGPGYWVLTPLERASGGIVWINRGFVPQGAEKAFSGGGAVPSGEVTVIGLARVSAGTTPFTPSPDVAHRIEWVRNIDRLDALLGETDQSVAPLYVDKTAGEYGALPQGGETKVNFPNRHLEYASTWFGLALATPVMLSFWLKRRRGK